MAVPWVRFKNKTKKPSPLDYPTGGVNEREIDFRFVPFTFVLVWPWIKLPALTHQNCRGGGQRHCFLFLDEHGIGAVSPCPWTDFWAMPLDPPMFFFCFFFLFFLLVRPTPPSVTTFNFSVYLLSLYTTFSFFTLSWQRWRRGSSHRRPWRHLRWLDHSACWCRGRACRLPAITQLVLLSGNCFNFNRTQNDHYILISVMTIGSDC